MGPECVELSTSFKKINNPSVKELGVPDVNSVLFLELYIDSKDNQSF